MDQEKLDALVSALSAPLFIYRMSKPVTDGVANGEEYEPRIAKGAQTKMDNASREIHEIVLAYAKREAKDG